MYTKDLNIVNFIKPLDGSTKCLEVLTCFVQLGLHVQLASSLGPCSYLPACLVIIIIVIT